MIPVPTSAGGNAPEFIKRMLLILTLRKIFKILRAIVGFVSILVIHCHALFAWSNESLGDEAVNKESLHMAVVLQDDSAIAKPIAVASHKSDADASDVSQARNPIQALIVFDRTPLFSHGFNYTGMCDLEV